MKSLLSRVTQINFTLLTISVFLFYSCETTNIVNITSPDGAIKTLISTKNSLWYSVIFNEDTILNNSKINIALKGFDKLDEFEITSITKTSTNTSWDRIWGKRKKVIDHYNQLQLKEIKSNVIIDLYVCAYDDGVGIRYGFPEQEGLSKIELTQEKTQFSFSDDYTIWRAD